MNRTPHHPHTPPATTAPPAWSLPTGPTKRETHRLLHVLTRERSRIDRCGGVLSLVVFSLPRGVWFKRPRMRRLIAVLERRLRITDEVGIIDGQRAFALLADTDALGAEVLARQVQRRAAEDGFSLSFAVFRYVSGKQSPPAITQQAPQNQRDDRDDHTGPPSQTPPTNGHGHHIHRPTDVPMRIRSVTPPPHQHHITPTFQVKPQPQRVEQESCIMANFGHRLPWWKRGVDLLVATPALLIALPLMLAVAAAIRLESKGPAIFIQLRRGAHRRPFRIYKFRTMVSSAEAHRQALKNRSDQDGPAFKMRNDPRITRVGKFLRTTSIDELPQLFNVLKGDMTLVGPRPLPVHEADECESWQDARHSVHPGLTCIWQVTGRSQVSFAEWARMDLGYIRKRSLWQDLKILFATIPAVVKRDGAC